MGIIKKVIAVAVLYAAIKGGIFCYNVYDKCREEGVKPLIENVIQGAGSYVKQAGQYIESVDMTEQKKEQGGLERVVE